MRIGQPRQQQRQHSAAGAGSRSAARRLLTWQPPHMRHRMPLACRLPRPSDAPEQKALVMDVMKLTVPRCPGTRKFLATSPAGSAQRSRGPCAACTAPSMSLHIRAGTGGRARGVRVGWWVAGWAAGGALHSRGSTACGAQARHLPVTPSRRPGASETRVLVHTSETGSPVRHQLGARPHVAVKGHVLDEAHVEGRGARERHPGRHLVVVHAPHHHHVDLDCWGEVWAWQLRGGWSGQRAQWQQHHHDVDLADCLRKGRGAGSAELSAWRLHALACPGPTGPPARGSPRRLKEREHSERLQPTWVEAQLHRPPDGAQHSRMTPCEPSASATA